ncbi:GLPGLI family protein [Pedobacter sp.]
MNKIKRPLQFSLIALLVIFLYPQHVFSQTGEPVVLSVTYQFKHVNDLNKPKSYLEEEMILRLGKTESRYGSWTEELRYKAPPKIVNTSKPSTGSKGGAYGFSPTVNVNINGIKDFDLAQYPNERKMKRVVVIGDNNYMVEGALPEIDWKLFDDKRQIAGYDCQKAVGNYAGRTYTAWYSAALPFRNGPWKLWGLPGLILEATDATGQVSFLFKELNKPGVNETTALRKKRIIKTTDKAIDRAIKAFSENPTAVYQSQLPATITTKAQIAFIDSDGTMYMGSDGKKLYNAYKKGLKMKKNNPLELN